MAGFRCVRTSSRSPSAISCVSWWPGTPRRASSPSPVTTARRSGGGATVRDVLFPAPGDSADCEGLSEFRERTLRARLGQTATRLHQVLQDHGKANTMVALMKVYQEEDELYQELVTMATTFFQYLLQPFRDMREVATSCKLGILKSLDEDELGPRRVAALQKEASEWTRQAEEAVGSIQDITVNYFKETVTALTGMQKQMEQDQKRFGQAAWATAMPRLENLKLMLARETLQLMRAKELCLKHRQAEIQRKVDDLPRQGKQLDVVDELEIQCYDIQSELYDVKLEMLRNEETILVTRLDSVKRLITEKQAEVIYYDPCESPEELQSLAPDLELHLGDNRELRALSQQCQRLEAQRGRICSREPPLERRILPEILLTLTAKNLNTHQTQYSMKRDSEISADSEEDNDEPSPTEWDR
nr:unnamed protein product [Mus musculus]